MKTKKQSRTQLSCANECVRKWVLILCGTMFAVIAQANQDLLDAAGNGDIAQIDQVLATGVDVNARDEAGYTALMQAASKGHLQAVQHLREKGADVTLRNENGNNAYKLAINFGYYDVADYLKPHMKEQRQYKKYSNNSRRLVYELRHCKGKHDVIKSARKIFLLRGWSDIKSTADTVEATMKRRYDHRAKLHYLAGDNLITLEYSAEPFGKVSWLAKVGKQVRKEHLRQCR